MRKPRLLVSYGLGLSCLALCGASGGARAATPTVPEGRLPGAPAFSAALQQRLRTAWEAQSAQSFLTGGLLDLYEAGDRCWLREAIDLDQVLAQHYEDSRAGGFFLASDDHERLLAREKPSYDGAEPSGNSVEALNLLRLYELTTDDRYRRRAERTLRAFGQILTRSPTAMAEMLLAVDYHLDSPREIVIVAPWSRADAEPFLARLRAIYLPNRVLVVVSQGDDLSALAKVVPLVQGKVAQGGKATAYVCENQVCQLPTSDPAVFARQISQVRPLPAAGPTSPKR